MTSADGDEQIATLRARIGSQIAVIEGFVDTASFAQLTMIADDLQNLMDGLRSGVHVTNDTMQSNQA